MTNTPNTENTIGRNTKMCPKKYPTRARSWCFTWNNHTVEDWHTCTGLFKDYGIGKIMKLVCQEEEGENETRHIQGFIKFKNAIEFNTMRKINKRIHWERCRNIPASINYCTKIETRSGESFQYGTEQPKEDFFKVTKEEWLGICLEYWKKKMEEDLAEDIKKFSNLNIWGIGYQKE